MSKLSQDYHGPSAFCINGLFGALQVALNGNDVTLDICGRHWRVDATLQVERARADLAPPEARRLASAIVAAADAAEVTPRGTAPAVTRFGKHRRSSPAVVGERK